MDDLEFIAFFAYAGEPCRICGRILSMEDIKSGAVFAGYSKDNKSRAAHKHCFDNAMEIWREMHPESPDERP